MSRSGSSLVVVSSADHCKTLVSALGNLFDSRRGTDFDFNWNGKSVRAHRTILELFLSTGLLDPDGGDHQYDPPIQQKMRKDASRETAKSVLDCVLEFLYKGEVAVQETEMESLLSVARELDFRLLVDAVQACSAKLDKNTAHSVSPSSVANPIEAPCEFSDPKGFKNDESLSSSVVLMHKIDADDGEIPSALPLTDRIYVSGAPNKTESSSETSALRRGSDLESSPPAKKRTKFGDQVEPNDATGTELGLQNKSFSCRYCSYVCWSESDVIQHTREVHSEAGDLSRRRLCESCGFLAVSPDALVHHMNICAAPKAEIEESSIDRQPFACQRCNCLYSASTKQRCSETRGSIEDEGSLDRRRLCETCGSLTATQSGLEHHKHSHARERRLTCDVCGRVFQHDGALRSHALVHVEGYESTDCHVCGCGFDERAGLELHLRTVHHIWLPLKCPHCCFVSDSERRIRVHGSTAHPDACGDAVES